MPTQAVDDDATELTQLLQGVREQKRHLWSQKDKMDNTAYMNHLHQLEEKEMGLLQQLQIKSQDTMTMQYINQLELKCASLEKQVEMLTTKPRDAEGMVSHYCICQLCHQLKETIETLHKQLQMHEHLHLLDKEQIERLRAYVLNPSHLSGTRYPMNRSPHGIAVIITNCKFHSATPTTKLLPNIRGTKSDIKNLYATWKHLGYDVHVLSNLTASELILHLKPIASANHDNYDSFVCCILSYGCQDSVYGSDSEIVKICDIAALFKSNPTLIDKPKLFFTYTYRASKEPVAAVAPTCEPARNCCLPIETDFVFCSINMSWRSRSKCISVFHEVAKKYATQEQLLFLLRIINYKLFETNNHQDCEQAYCDCCPAFCFTSLCKEVWFFTK